MIEQLPKEYVELVAACEAVEQSLSPYRGDGMSPEKAYTVSRSAIQQLRKAIVNVRKEEEGK